MPKKKSYSKQFALPLPAPAKIERPTQLAFNQLVTLHSDTTFRGHVFGKMPDGTEYIISIKEPGKTGKRGCKFFPAKDVVPV